MKKQTNIRSKSFAPRTLVRRVETISTFRSTRNSNKKMIILFRRIARMTSSGLVWKRVRELIKKMIAEKIADRATDRQWIRAKTRMPAESARQQERVRERIAKAVWRALCRRRRDWRWKFSREAILGREIAKGSLARRKVRATCDEFALRSRNKRAD